MRADPKQQSIYTRQLGGKTVSTAQRVGAYKNYQFYRIPVGTVLRQFYFVHGQSDVSALSVAA